MEANLMGFLSFISMFLVINCQTAVPLENLSEQEIETAIYYGDLNVTIGEPFKITCIISISEPINWVKDGEPITNHNLRHWRDEHSYITSESAIDGERHKIEAHISVRHALKAHQGKYQCNSLHPSYHMLTVHKNKNFYTKPDMIDSSESSISTPFPEYYLPSATDIFTVSNTAHHGITPYTSTSPASNRKHDIPLQKLITTYSNGTNIYNNHMYTIPDELQLNTARGITTNSGREEHINIFDKPKNITGVLLVHPSAFPVTPEYIEMITRSGKVLEQSPPTEQITTRQYYVPIMPGVTTYNKPTATATSTSTTSTNFFRPITNEPDLLVPNYDNVEHQVKKYVIRSQLVLGCNITKEGDYDLIWEKNGTEVSKVSSLNGRYQIIKPERKFIIEKTEESDAGTYSCRVNNDKKDFRVVADLAVRVPSNTGVVEGEKMTIHCLVAGTDPQLYWQTGNLTIYNTTGRFELKEDENKVKNAILIMDNTSLDDRGDYTCLARNIITDLNLSKPASSTSFVRVKGKLAALWPFLGICAEVIILCTIILIYEKRRNKAELDESDTDPNTEQ